VGRGRPVLSVELADVPVGGAVAAKDASGAPIIVAQPTAGTAVAFSAICTHMQCQVAPAGKRLDCPCHGSQYDATNGAVLRGPATRPLPAVPSRVEERAGRGGVRLIPQAVSASTAAAA
jgi:Rieske Fe-S protein